MHAQPASEAENLSLNQPEADMLDENQLTVLPEDAGQVCSPPARIAARFYRSSNGTRRKSSAASSRRNSLSSTHSHQSSRSYRGGCQSSHVAQHLRRASILESRKARLADRAAHAEQVRLRAALAKAAPRASNSEERALAAQQARDKHLAQVAAACAEEVKRAKKIAEDMKERKAAEEKRYRLEMEERFAEAQRRRLEYKRNMRRPRTASVPAADGKKPLAVAMPALDEETAAQRLQRVWRARRRRRIVSRFLELGISIEHVQEAPFEDISDRLSEESVVAATSSVLRLFQLPRSDTSQSEQWTGVRTFLSAYLILGHPASVLSKDGDQEQDLINKAKDLVITFESALADVATTGSYAPTPTQIETISQSYGVFVTAFSAWKARDFSTLVDTMVASFVELDAIWQTVKDDTSGEVANDYRDGIRDNQVQLLGRLKRLVGIDRANQMILKAIRESRRGRARRRRRPAGDARPRPLMSQDVASASAEGAEAVPDGSVAASQLTPSAVDAQTEGRQTVSLTQLFSAVPPNRVLAHELAIDKEYRIELGHSKLRAQLYAQVCESMKMGFENGEGVVWTVAMAQNIRAKLLRLLKSENSMYKLISEAMDPEYIQTQCAKGIFSYEKFFAFMVSILPKLCAPIRDADVKSLCDELQKPEDGLSGMIHKLLRLLQVIDMLSLDFSNYILSQAAPTLIAESANYERKLFAQDLERGEITLQKTKRWWSDASVNVITEADRRDPANRPTFLKIYARGLVDLAIATQPVRDVDVPETLQLDRERISRIRSDVVRIVTIGAILLTAKNMLKRDVRSPWKAEASRMWEALKDGYTKDNCAMSDRLLSVIESSHALPPATKTQLGGTIGRFLGQADAGRLTDPVTKVLFQRLKSHILVRVSASSSGERVRAASTASEGLAASGIPEFIGQVGNLVDELARISDVDRKAHGPWYEQIAQELEDTADETG